MIAKGKGARMPLNLALLDKRAQAMPQRGQWWESFEGKGIWKPQQLNVKDRGEECGWVLVWYVARLQCTNAVLRNDWK